MGALQVAKSTKDICSNTTHLFANLSRLNLQKRLKYWIDIDLSSIKVTLNCQMALFYSRRNWELIMAAPRYCMGVHLSIWTLLPSRRIRRREELALAKYLRFNLIRAKYKVCIIKLSNSWERKQHIYYTGVFAWVG